MSIDPRLDPSIVAHLEQVQEGMSTAHELTAVEMRQNLQDNRMPPGELASMHEVRDVQITAPHGTINCRLYKPVDEDTLPLLVWYHGGGWVLGDLDSADMPCRDLAKKSGCLVLSVDYRLAPEHPFPAAFDDALTALHWSLDNAASLGADKERIAVGGDSAGANLAACACLAAKDRGVKFQLLIYPVIEADFTHPSYEQNADGYFLTTNLMKWFWDQYARPDERHDPRVAPLHGNLQGLPPAYVLTVHFDPLRDEGDKYSKALKGAGVTVETATSGDAVHGFFTMPVPPGVQARSEAASRLKKALM